MTTIRILIAGAVQGVGFRAFVQREALAADVRGWVRNRRDGTVEAVLAGSAVAVDRVVDRCREGPPGAAVGDLAVGPCPEPIGPGFQILPAG